MRVNRVFLILYNTLNYAEKKIKEFSKDYSIISFPQKSKKISSNGEIVLGEIIKINNKRLFFSREDIILENIENLEDDEILQLLKIIKSSSIKFFLLFREEKKLEIIKNHLLKNEIGYELYDLRIRGYIDIKKIINNEIKKLGLNLPKEFIEILVDNYKNDIATFFQDLKKLEIYLDNKNNITGEEIKNFFQSTSDEFKIQESFLSLNFPVFVSKFKKYINSLASLPYQERLNRINNLFYNLLFGALVKIYLLKINPNTKIDGHPFYISKLKELASQLDLQTIKILLKTLAVVDRKVKKYYLNYKELAEEIVVSYFLLQRSD